MIYEIHHEREGLQLRCAGKATVREGLKELRREYLRPDALYVVRVNSDGERHRLGAETLQQLLR